MKCSSKLIHFIQEYAFECVFYKTPAIFSRAQCVKDLLSSQNQVSQKTLVTLITSRSNFKPAIYRNDICHMERTHIIETKFSHAHTSVKTNHQELRDSQNADTHCFCLQKKEYSGCQRLGEVVAGMMVRLFPIQVWPKVWRKKTHKVLQIFQNLQCLNNTSILTMIRTHIICVLTRYQRTDNSFLWNTRPIQLLRFTTTILP